MLSIIEFLFTNKNIPDNNTIEASIINFKNKISEQQGQISYLRNKIIEQQGQISHLKNKIITLTQELNTKDEHIISFNRDYSELFDEYKTLKEDYQTNIKSINNELPFACKQNLSEIVTPNSDYLIWGSCIFFAVIACALGYYFLSNKTNIVEQLNIFKRNDQQTLIENLNNRESSNSPNQNIVPEIDIPELTTNTINDNSIINEEAFNYVYDEAFTQFAYQLIDDSLLLGLRLNNSPQVFDLILENNQMLQQLLLINEPTTSMAVTSTISSLI